MTNHSSQKRDSLQKLLSEKLFRSKHLDFVTNRQVHHWNEIGLLDDHRKYAASGMKNSFNFYQSLWIRTIVEIRSFGISNLQIKEIKGALFDLKKDVVSETFLFTYTIQEVILDNHVIFLNLEKNTSIKMLNKEEYSAGIDNGRITHHFALRLDLLIWEMLALLDLTSKVQKIIQHDKDTKNE